MHMAGGCFSSRTSHTVCATVQVESLGLATFVHIHAVSLLERVKPVKKSKEKHIQATKKPSYIRESIRPNIGC